jgi:hypothetical protein
MDGFQETFNMSSKRMFIKISTTLAIAGLMNIGGVAWAATQLSMTTPINLSNQAVLAGGSANKTKLVRLGNGTLISVFGDAVGSNLVYDLKGDAERIARDIFMTRCNPLTAANACTLETDWSTPVNLSNSALLTSMQANWRGAGQENYYGDSDKPAIHNSGPMATVTWGDKYCPDGDQSTPGVQAPVQRAVAYIERDDRVVPFNCMYESHSLNNGATWSAPQQLSNGIRDAKQDSNKGAYSSTSGIAKWSIVWQEDPLGLQIGQAEGPGEGASGAKVSHGTDVWYTTTSNLADLVTSPWTVVRLTNNFDGSFGVPGSTNPVRDGTGAEVNPGTIEKGNTGASRPNLAVVSGQALVAYEETKRSIDVDEGKYIRYHSFPQTTAPTSDSGCILSTPTKNGRRVRFVTQGTPGPNDMRMAIFWKEGEATQGGPSDIVARIGFADFTAANMLPPVDTLNCEENDYNTIIGNLNNTMGYNISTESPTATAANLADDTELNWIENGLAHRALIRGDDLYVGYAYTADLAQQAYTNTDNYNFWIRHYNAATATWDNPGKVTNITDTSVNVREPRLVGTPGNGPNCPGGVPTDPTNPAHLQQCQDRNTFIVAWGTQTNVSAWDPAGPEDLTIFMTRTTNKGATYEPAVQVPTVATGAFESQLRPTPDGNTVYFAWNQSDAQREGMFSVGTPVTLFSDMAVSVTSIPTDVVLGSDFDISYEVENLGPDKAFDVSLVINLPASVTYVSGDAACAHAAGTVTCALGDMDSTDITSVDITVQATVVDPALTFTATVASSSPDDPVAGNNQVSSDVNATDMGLAISDIAVSATAVPSSLKEGKHTDVSIVLENNGPFAATGVRLAIDTPAGWEQSLLTISQGSCLIDGRSFVCDVGNLVSGASAIVRLNGSVDDDGVVSFVANGSAAEFDPDMANNVSSVSVTFKKDSDDDDDNIFGCTVGKPGGFDPTLLFVVIASLLYLTRRKLKETGLQE